MNKLLVSAWVVIGLIIAFLWLHVAEHRSDALMNYGDCVLEHTKGTSIPLEDAWLMFADVCK